MRCEDKEVRKIGQLIDHISNDLNDYPGPVWYRGQANLRWRLEPRLMRVTPPLSETHLLNKFKQNASFLVKQRPKDDFEWLFLMQHYGYPTRLLDWTESPLTALYFVINSNQDEDGALWILLPTVLNEKSNFKPEFEYEIPSFEDDHLRNYLPDTIAHETRSKLFPLAAIAPRNSARMQAQLGVFTITHRENLYIEDVGAPGAVRDHVWRFVIPSDAKLSLSKELRLLAYTKFQLFPELESLADYL